MMTLKNVFLVVGTAAALGIGLAVPVQAQITDTSSGSSSDNMGPGLTGRGFYGIGPGMMGPTDGAGPALKGPGYGYGGGPASGLGPGYGIGPGYGMMPPGQGYSAGMMGPAYGMDQGSRSVPAAIEPLQQDLSVAQVRRMLERQLKQQGNPNVKLGKVAQKNADTIVAEIVTKDGSVVRRLEVNRHTGRVEVNRLTGRVQPPSS